MLFYFVFLFVIYIVEKFSLFAFWLGFWPKAQKIRQENKFLFSSPLQFSPFSDRHIWRYICKNSLENKCIAALLGVKCKKSSTIQQGFFLLRKWQMGFFNDKLFHDIYPQNNILLNSFWKEVNKHQWVQVSDKYLERKKSWNG